MFKVLRKSNYYLVFILLAILPFVFAISFTGRHTGNSSAFSSDNPVSDDWVINNGYTESIISDSSGRIYLGGRYQYVGPNTGGAIMVDGTNGDIDNSMPKVEGSLSAVISDGAGGWFVAGEFFKVGDVLVTRVAHILADKSVDSDFNPSPDKGPVALAYDGTNLYMGGDFDNVDGTAQAHFAAVNASNGELLPIQPTVDNRVVSIAINGSNIYFGGFFTNVNGSTRNKLAAIDSSGNLLSWAPSVGPGWVQTMVSDGADILVGGDFTSINVTTRNYIAAINATTGNLTSWDPNANSGVNTIFVDGTDVYVGGGFSSINSVSSDGLASIDRVTAAVSSWLPSPTVSNSPSGVVRLTVISDKVFIYGSFDEVNDIAIRGFAALDKVTGDPLFSDLDLGLIGDAAMATDGADVYFGGGFTSVGGEFRTDLVRLLPNGEIDPSWNLSPVSASAQISAMVIRGNTLYIGGQFTQIAGQVRNNFAAIDIETGNLLPWAPSFNAQILSLFIEDDILFVGGDFTTADGVGRTRLAAFNLNSQLLLNWNPTVNDYVRTIAADDDNNLFIGGSFTSVNGSARSRVAQFDISDLNSITLSSFSHTFDSYVYGIVFYEDKVFIGGTFSTVDGQPQQALVAFDRLTNIKTSLNYDFNFGAVYGLGSDDTTLYLGGYFEPLEGKSGISAAAIDLDSEELLEWKPLNEDVAEVPIVDTIYADESYVYIGGDDIEIAGDESHSDFFRLPRISTQFSSTSGSVQENQGSFNIPVVLNNTSPEDTTINYMVVEGSAISGEDYNLSNGTLTIPAGNPSGNIVVTLLNNPEHEIDETIEIVLSSPTNSSLGNNTNYILTLTDDDPELTPTPTPSPTDTPTLTPTPTEQGSVSSPGVSLTPSPTPTDTPTPTPTLENPDTITTPTVIFTPTPEPPTPTETPKNPEVKSFWDRLTSPVVENILSLQKRVEEIVPEIIVPIIKEVGVLGTASLVITAPAFGSIFAIYILPLIRLLLIEGYLFPLIGAFFLNLFGRRRPGRALDDFTNEGIALVAIRVINIETGKLVKKTITTVSGKYYMRLSPGKYQFEFSRYDYRKYLVQLSLETTKDVQEVVLLTQNEGRDISANIQYQVFKIDPKRIGVVFGVVLALMNALVLSTVTSWIIFGISVILMVYLFGKKRDFSKLNMTR